MIRGRAYTRHQRDKSRARRKRQIDSSGFYTVFPELYPSHENICRMSTYRGMCSCWMCGNPRRHFGELTMQERKAE